MSEWAKTLFALIALAAWGALLAAGGGSNCRDDCVEYYHERQRLWEQDAQREAQADYYSDLESQHR